MVPNLYIIGVPKGGTTSLARWLADHPDIAGGTEKELRILMDAGDPLARPGGYHAEGLSAFAEHFPPDATARRWQMDASPEYYYQDTALDVIGDMPGARVVLLLRDPAERVLSMFRFAKYNIGVLPRDLSFRCFLGEIAAGKSSDLLGDRPMLRDAIQHGEYIRYLRAWQRRMGEDRIKTVLLDDLREDPAATVSGIVTWLGVDDSAYAGYDFPIVNETYVTRSATLHRWKRAVQGAVPTMLRRHLAPLYRAVNTSRDLDRSMTDDDRQALEGLRTHFQPWNDLLRESLRRPAPIWPHLTDDRPAA